LTPGPVAVGSDAQRGFVARERDDVAAALVDIDDREQRPRTKVERLGQLDPRRDTALAAVPARGG
jgi:hypothetical protein